MIKSFSIQKSSNKPPNVFVVPALKSPTDLVVDLNYFPFSHPNPNPNPTHLPKHEFTSPNNQFYQHIWYVEYYSVHAYMVWSQKFRLTPDSKKSESEHLYRPLKPMERTSDLIKMLNVTKLTMTCMDKQSYQAKTKCRATVCPENGA